MYKKDICLLLLKWWNYCNTPTMERSSIYKLHTS